MKKLMALVFILLVSIVYSYPKAPDFNLKDLNGDYISLEDFKGKRVFLIFWATWCPSCQKAMKEIAEFQKENIEKTNEIVFLGITNEDERVVNDYLKENNYKLKALFNKDKKLYDEYAVEGVPTMYFINEESDVTGFIQGNITKEKLESKL